MFFEKERFSAHLIAVLHLTWKSGKSKIQPRTFSALALRLRGRGIFHLSNGQELISSEGEVLYLPQGLGYEADYDDNEMLVFHFYEENPSDHAERFPIGATSPVTELFWEGLRSFQSDHPKAKLQATSLFYRILAELISDATDSPAIGSNTPFSRALTLMTAEYTDVSLSLADICRRAGISESAFRRIFSNRYGKPPIQFLTDLRLREAQRLLLCNTGTVEEIAHACGFWDVKYFSRVVKKHLGASPSQLRGI